jgi:predicted Rossmann fold nucleotide-binding protein DprA/Smf involved in DNA uptake
MKMTLAADSQAMLMLCSRLSLSDQSAPKPLTLREWNSLAHRLLDSSVGTPGGLLGLSLDELQSELGLSEDESERLVRLLSRGGGLAVELERLESLGMWVLTRADVHYPQRLKRRLQHAAPPVLFGAGERELLGQPGLAVVGSRNVDDSGRACADFIGNACARDGLVLYSGGARGVDAISTNAALEARGTAVGVLAHSLEQSIRSADVRPRLMSGDLALITPYSPNAGFNVGAAMGRNKLIYALADYALVIASEVGKGGTWAGATEALKAKWVPVFVLDGPNVPEGNQQLQQKGAISFPVSLLSGTFALREWLEARADDMAPPPTQPRLI